MDQGLQPRPGIQLQQDASGEKQRKQTRESSNAGRIQAGEREEEAEMHSPGNPAAARMHPGVLLIRESSEAGRIRVVASTWESSSAGRVQVHITSLRVQPRRTRSGRDVRKVVDVLGGA